MNKVILMGRLTRDPDVRYSQGESPMCVARYTLAVDRRQRRQEGQQEADFISCVAFGKSGEFAEKYLHKGSKIAVTGRIQTGSYTNRDGQKVYTTDVVIEDQEFAENKGQSSGSGPDVSAAVTTSAGPVASPPEAARPVQSARQEYQQSTMDGFMNIPDDIDEELPFN